MPRDELIARIAASSDRIAHDVLVSGPLQGHEGDATDLVRDVVDALIRSLLLSKRTQAHRLENLLRGLPLHPDQVSSLAQAAREFPAHLRATVASALPASARLEVYRSASTARTPTIGRNSDALPPMVKHALRALGRLERSQEVPGYSMVLLLSHPDHQASNQALLRGNGFDPLVVETLDGLQRVLDTSTEVCGCVIDQSHLSLLNANEQESLIRILANYSSFITIRVHECPALHISRDRASQIIKAERQLGIPVPVQAIAFQTDGRIQASELAFFANAARLLQAHESTSFVLGDLVSTEAQLLVAAVRARALAGSFNSGMDSTPLTVRFLPGGHSGARLATVRCGVTQAFVAKVTTKDDALGEMRRFRTFVQPWDNGLRPECHFHGEAAVIFFDLVRADGDSATPAETLDKRLRDTWDRQWLRMPSASVGEDGLFLAKALTRVAQTLAELNKCAPPKNGDSKTFVNPPSTHFDALDREGFVWGLSDRAKESRKIAAERIRQLKGAAIVHGDIHLSNVLIRGESEVHLIDYAASGPGHPAVDLVRLELALYLGPVRQFEDDVTSVAFQKAISIDRASLDCLRQHFPGFFKCHVNAACAAGMTAARDAAFEVLRVHGGDRLDYLSMKFLVAWQHLGFIGSQTALARAVIHAITGEIAKP